MNTKMSNCYWCPNECGKCVFFSRYNIYKKNPKNYSIYKCKRCKKEFTKKDLKIIRKSNYKAWEK